MEEKEMSFKEQRIRKITQLYYSRPEIQKAIYEFAKNREISPRYFEEFGRRPDSFQYERDVFEIIKKGATSLHCSEELWRDPLQIVTGMPEAEANRLRIGWDLLIDIDSKYIDYSKILAKIIIKMLNFHGIKNLGIKFSGSKGFHIIIPWNAFPREVNNKKTSGMFPAWPRIMTQYIMEKIKPQLINQISMLQAPNKYIKDFKAPAEVMPDLILVSPRHLFRMPYSLHEKTSLASIPLAPEELDSFELKDADPIKISKIKNFLPDAREGEASQLLMQALDWYKEKFPEGENNSYSEKNYDFKPIKLSNLSEENFPPCVKNILNGVSDGRKRALFILINLFRSVGMDKDELEKRIDEWNNKNEVPIKQGYIKSQLIWTHRKKPVMPPNCEEFYKNLGVCQPDAFCKKIKNPVNYVVRKNFLANRKEKN